jgi:hypothetical protein
MSGLPGISRMPSGEVPLPSAGVARRGACAGRIPRPNKTPNQEPDEVAMTSNGLTHGGATAHFQISYDETFLDQADNPLGPEPGRCNRILAACEADYERLSNWFGGRSDVTGLAVQVTDRAGVGADLIGGPQGARIALRDAVGFDFRFDPLYLRYLVLMEAARLFMQAQGNGWFLDADGRLNPEADALARFLGAQFLAAHRRLDLQSAGGFGVGEHWLNSARMDLLHPSGTEPQPQARVACATLFLYYLYTQLGFTTLQIVGTRARDLAGLYRSLTGDEADPFVQFRILLADAYPVATPAELPGPNVDDPFPLPRQVSEAACEGIVLGLDRLISSGLPGPRYTSAEWRKVVQSLQTCVAQGLLPAEEVAKLIGKYEAYARQAERPPFRPRPSL